MKIFNKVSVGVLTMVCILGLTGSMAAFAATTPSLGVAATYGVLSSTYTNTVLGTTINGDLGYTTGPAVAPTVNGTTYVVNGTYNQAGTDQGSVLSALAAQPCTFTFVDGAIDLATDTTHGAIGVYTPGVYCIAGAASIGTAGITLNGNGTYIFRINGALTTVVNSHVTLSGASACDVFWTPTQATTLAANTTFAGTVIDAAGITAGANSMWTGMALAFGGTVTTDATNIIVPVCTIAPPTPTPTPVPEIVTPVVVNNTGSTLSTPAPNVVNNTGTITSTPVNKIVPIVVYEPAPTLTSQVTPPITVVVPRLPHTGIAPEGESTSWNIAVLAGILVLISTALIFIQRKRRV